MLGPKANIKALLKYSFCFTSKSYSSIPHPEKLEYHFGIFPSSSFQCTSPKLAHSPTWFCKCWLCTVSSFPQKIENAKKCHGTICNMLCKSNPIPNVEHLGYFLFSTSINMAKVNIFANPSVGDSDVSFGQDVQKFGHLHPVKDWDYFQIFFFFFWDCCAMLDLFSTPCKPSCTAFCSAEYVAMFAE